MVCRNVLQRIAMCCSVLQRVAVCCSVLQRVAILRVDKRKSKRRSQQEKELSVWFLHACECLSVRCLLHVSVSVPTTCECLSVRCLRVDVHVSV